MTGKYGCVLAVMAILGAATGARAQETGPATTASHEQERAAPSKLHGWELGLRAGFQLGAGYVYKNGHSPTGELRDLKISDAASGAIPGQLEVGYRLNRHLVLGIYGQYAYVFTKTNDVSCPTGFDCSAWQWSFGPEALYHFSPGAKFEPWVGLGVGMQILRTNISGTVPIPLPTGGTVSADTKASVTDRGPELNLSVGGDFRLGERFRLGPFLTVTLANYTVHVGDQKVTIPGLETQTIPVGPVDNGFHALFALGARLGFF